MRLGLGIPGIEKAKEIYEGVSQLPQTQRDIQAIAQATRRAQSPEFQERVQSGIEEVEDMGKTILVLQAISAAAVVGMFLLQFKESMK